MRILPMRRSILSLLALSFFHISVLSAALSAYKDENFFRMYYEPSDARVAKELAKVAVKSIEKMSQDFQHTLSGDIGHGKIQIMVYPNLQALHDAIKMPNAPNWLVGHYQPSSRTISMVSPNNPGPVHTYKNLFHTIRHQLANAFIFEKFANASIPRWLRTGCAMLEAEQIFLVKARLYILSKNHLLIPSLAQLEDTKIDNFVKMDGFACSYAFVEYLKEKWGWSTVLALLKDYSSFEAILNMSQDQFTSECIQFIDKKYGSE